MAVVMRRHGAPELAHNLSRLSWRITKMEQRMRKIVGLVGAVLLFTSPSLAADLQRKAPAYQAPPLAPVFSWTGFYVGGHGGFGVVDKTSVVLKGGVVGRPVRHARKGKVTNPNHPSTPNSPLLFEKKKMTN